MHIVVIQHVAKSDPEAAYYGSMAQAVGSVEPKTALLSVWGGVWNSTLCRFDLEDISGQFIEAWEAAAKVRCEERFKDADPDQLSECGRADEYQIDRWFDRHLEETPIIISPVTSVRPLSALVAAE
jgi:hypothetical protein